MLKLRIAAMLMVMITTLNRPRYLSATYPGMYRPRIPTALVVVINAYDTVWLLPLAVAYEAIYVELAVNDDSANDAPKVANKNLGSKKYLQLKEDV